MNWIVGILFSTLIGAIITGSFLWTLRKCLDLKKDISHEKKRVSPILTGIIERLFFTMLIGFNMQSTPIAMIAWITVKMVSHWNRPGTTGQPDLRVYSFTALLTGLISMLFAVIGGHICNGTLKF